MPEAPKPLLAATNFTVTSILLARLAESYCSLSRLLAPLYVRHLSERSRIACDSRNGKGTERVWTIDAATLA